VVLPTSRDLDRGTASSGSACCDYMSRVHPASFVASRCLSRPNACRLITPSRGPSLARTAWPIASSMQLGDAVAALANVALPNAALANVCGCRARETRSECFEVGPPAIGPPAALGVVHVTFIRATLVTRRRHSRFRKKTDGPKFSFPQVRMVTFPKPDSVRGAVGKRSAKG
jgi:hypothetical protein